MGRFIATKTFNYNEGLTCAYRIWQATDRRQYLHGYALNVKMIFECQELDTGQEVIDPDKFSEIVKWLHDTFDHTTCIDEKDPELMMFKILNKRKAIDLKILPGVGCERFSELIWHRVYGWLHEQHLAPRVIIRTVEVWEHDGRSALHIE
jgi:6-pyruvoyltetrahydropterin/6-carboxytetrahydropterin synthase